MKDKISIRSPEVLHICGYGTTFYGGDQGWYRSHWQRQAGCGPVTCSHLMRYLAQTRPDCKELCPYDGGTQDGFLQLMEDVWRHVTPGMMGLNRTSMLTEGAEEYARGKGIRLHCRTFEIDMGERAGYGRMQEFLAGALEADLPVAFLNLSNGSLKNLESWHWVTIVSMSLSEGTAIIYDQGYRKEVDLRQWLATTALGGGLVAIEQYK